MQQEADYLPLLFIGVAFCSVANNSLADAGTRTDFAKTMELPLTSLP
jgi:hypothetical protein